MIYTYSTQIYYLECTKGIHLKLIWIRVHEESNFFDKLKVGKNLPSSSKNYDKIFMKEEDKIKFLLSFVYIFYVQKNLFI